MSSLLYIAFSTGPSDNQEVGEGLVEFCCLLDIFFPPPHAVAACMFIWCRDFLWGSVCPCLDRHSLCLFCLPCMWPVSVSLISACVCHHLCLSLHMASLVPSSSSLSLLASLLFCLPVCCLSACLSSLLLALCARLPLTLPYHPLYHACCACLVYLPLLPAHSMRQQPLIPAHHVSSCVSFLSLLLKKHMLLRAGIGSRAACLPVPAVSCLLTLHWM